MEKTWKRERGEVWKRLRKRGKDLESRQGGGGGGRGGGHGKDLEKRGGKSWKRLRKDRG